MTIDLQPAALQVAPHLEHFLAPWCAALRLLNDGVEKEHAFQGLCSTVRHNPQVIMRRQTLAAFLTYTHLSQAEIGKPPPGICAKPFVQAAWGRLLYRHAISGPLSSFNPPAVCVNPQAAAASFKSIVEAVLSWQTLHNEALAGDILQILNLHKVSPESGRTASRAHQLNPHTHPLHVVLSTHTARLRRCATAGAKSAAINTIPAHLQKG
jgi:hypothetical protein